MHIPFNVCAVKALSQQASLIGALTWPVDLHQSDIIPSNHIPNGPLGSLGNMNL